MRWFDSSARAMAASPSGGRVQSAVQDNAPAAGDNGARETAQDTAARTSPRPRGPRIGFAIGAGSARGWAHIGVVRELHEAGIRPSIIAGSSVGAVVGACYCAGKLDELEDFARSLSRRRLFGLLDVAFSGAGLITGGRLKTRLQAALGDMNIEDLPLPFTAVATEMGSGHEIWLNRGHLVESLRASYALPGIFEPVKINGRWLFDGALVNPVPTSVCHARGAELVIALNLNTEARRQPVDEDANATDALDAITEKITQENASAGDDQLDAKSPRSRSSLFRRQFSSASNGAPGIATAMIDAFNISQDRIARSRLAGDPPDIQIAPRLAGIGFFDFHRAAEMIDIGRETARKAIPEIRELAGLANKA